MQPTPEVTQAARYEVVAVVAPPQPAWLDLPALHEKLLPLAQQAGHERLVLMAEVGFRVGTCYQAYGAGGAADMRVYIMPGQPASFPAEFARELEERLRRQVETANANYTQL